MCGIFCFRVHVYYCFVRFGFFSIVLNDSSDLFICRVGRKTLTRSIFLQRRDRKRQLYSHASKRNAHNVLRETVKVYVHQGTWIGYNHTISCGYTSIFGEHFQWPATLITLVFRLYNLDDVATLVAINHSSQTWMGLHQAALSNCKRPFTLHRWNWTELNGSTSQLGTRSELVQLRSATWTDLKRFEI